MATYTETDFIEVQIKQLRDFADAADSEAAGCQRTIDRAEQQRDIARTRAAAYRTMVEALSTLLPKPADEPTQEAA